ncbi:MAG: glycosyltransferase family 2 protein [Methanomassiliicoccales archaeon]
MIPTMNEEESIGTVLDQVATAMISSSLEYEAMIVDTDSRDRTREIAQSKGARVIDEPRRGYGRAYKTGFQNAQGDIIATLDADCTYPAEEIPKLCGMLIEEELDFITTNRFGRMEAGAMKPSHRFGNRVLTMTLNLLFGLRLKDSQSGMWVFRSSCLERLELTSDGMPLSEEIKVEAFKKVRAKEVPICYRQRRGEVKLSSWKDGRRNFAFLWRKRFSRS